MHWQWWAEKLREGLGKLRAVNELLSTLRANPTPPASSGELAALGPAAGLKKSASLEESGPGEPSAALEQGHSGSRCPQPPGRSSDQIAPPPELPPVQSSPQAQHPPWLLRRPDQAVVAGLLLLGGLAILLWVRCQAGSAGRLIHIDQAPPLSVEFRVDINQAPWPELAQLPGIGPGLARRIVEYRATHGPFQCLSQLLQVPGIGPKRLEQIKPYLLPLPEQCPQEPGNHSENL